MDSALLEGSALPNQSQIETLFGKSKEGCSDKGGRRTTDAKYRPGGYVRPCLAHLQIQTTHSKKQIPSCICYLTKSKFPFQKPKSVKRTRAKYGKVRAQRGLFLSHLPARVPNIRRYRKALGRFLSHLLILARIRRALEPPKFPASLCSARFV